MLSYLEQENAFLDQLEQKLDETDNLQGGAEELQEAQDVSSEHNVYSICNKTSFRHSAGIPPGERS